MRSGRHINFDVDERISGFEGVRNLTGWVVEDQRDAEMRLAHGQFHDEGVVGEHEAAFERVQNRLRYVVDVHVESFVEETRQAHVNRVRDRGGMSALM